MSAIHNGGCVKTQFIRRWTFKLKFEHLKRLKRGGLSLLVRCQIKVHNCKCSYLCCNIILLFSEILLLIEFCFIPQFRSIIPCEVLLYIEVIFLGFIHWYGDFLVFLGSFLSIKSPTQTNGEVWKTTKKCCLFNEDLRVVGFICI